MVKTIRTPIGGPWAGSKTEPHIPTHMLRERAGLDRATKAEVPNPKGDFAFLEDSDDS